MKLELEVISFDLDNTLYDYERSFKNAIKMVFSAIKKKYPTIKQSDLESTYTKLRASAEQFAFRANKSSIEYRAERFNLLLQKFNIYDPSFVNSIVEIYSNNFTKNLKLFPDVKLVLEKLNKKYKLWVISEGPADMQCNTLEILDLKKYFSTLVFSSEVGLIKSDGSLFKYALEQLEIPPAKLIHIGDSQLRDIVGAKKAGLKAIWLNRNYETLLEGSPKPDYQISNLESLERYFK